MCVHEDQLEGAVSLGRRSPVAREPGPAAVVAQPRGLFNNIIIIIIGECIYNY